MQSSAPAPVMGSILPNSSKIIASRQHYQCCHIYLPDTDERVAAICVDQTYYGFFKLERDQKRALEISSRLDLRGHHNKITKSPKGYGIWVLEPQAIAANSSHRSRSHATEASTPIPDRVLSRHHYQPCHIRVPDIDKRLAAIAVDDQYYSLFKTVETLPQTGQIIKKLSQRGDKIIITQLAKGYGIWILELDAYLT